MSGSGSRRADASSPGAGCELWFSYARRSLFTGGYFSRLVQRRGVQGLSFDLDVFADLVGTGSEYRERIQELLERRCDAAAVIDQLLAEDAAAASDVLRPLHDESDGHSGWVAVDVPGHVPLEPDATITWWRRFRSCASCSNLMPKVPATGPGLAVAEGLLSQGCSVWFGAVFAPSQVRAVLDAHARGLTMAAAAGFSLESIRCVVAIHLLQIDVLVDEMLRRRARKEPHRRDLAESLIGRSGLAVALLARATVQEACHGERWRGLRGQSAVPLRVAFEGLDTVDPVRSEIDRVGRLGAAGGILVGSRWLLRRLSDLDAAPHPPSPGSVERAAAALDDLGEAGVPLDKLASDLQTTTVRRADERMAALRNRLESFRESGRVPVIGGVREELGTLASAVQERVLTVRPDLTERLWDADASLWSNGADLEQVRRRLGWLRLPEAMRFDAWPAIAFAKEVLAAGTPVLLLGMGGSSLGAEACRTALDAAGLRVLDTTVPRGVAALAARYPADRTLFVVASKSGTTLETIALAEYFMGRASQDPEQAGHRFVAITDPGTPLHERARRTGYARVWLNPRDVGGRFSVLSYFGLVPAALIGLDVPILLERARHMVYLAAPEVAVQDNPAVRLGVVLAEALAGGFDKLTLLARGRLSGLADWIEQLVAESLGKDGLGLVPVSDEPLCSADRYGSDRLFVWYRFGTDEVDDELAALVAGLRERKVPLLEIVLSDPHDLGREFVRWELAVAIAGTLLGVNPFDEPDVGAAKRRTRDLIAQFTENGSLPEPEPVVREGLLALYANVDTDPELAAGVEPEAGLGDWIRSHLARLQVPDYLAILAFLSPEPENWRALQGLRALVRDRLGVATTLGWGPRFLHSTGQLHKGGPESGAFLQLTADDAGDLEIPGRPYTFGVLARAQALGDYSALTERKRRVVRVHLAQPVEESLARLIETTRHALEDRCRGATSIQRQGG